MCPLLLGAQSLDFLPMLPQESTWDRKPPPRIHWHLKSSDFSGLGLWKDPPDPAGSVLSLKPPSLSKVCVHTPYMHTCVCYRQETVSRKLSLIPAGEDITMVTWEELEQAITDDWRASQAVNSWGGTGSGLRWCSPKLLPFFYCTVFCSVNAHNFVFPILDIFNVFYVDVQNFPTSGIFFFVFFQSYTMLQCDIHKYEHTFRVNS